MAYHFIRKPSFNFLAFQGIVFLISLLATTFVNIITKGFKPEVGLFEYIAMQSLYEMLGIPLIILCSCIIFFIFRLLKKENFLYSKYLFVPIFILFCCTYLFLLPISYKVEYGPALIETIIFVGFPCGIVLSAITFFLFTLIPYLILRYKEKKSDLTIENPPFAKNKACLTLTLFGVGVYVMTSIACVCIGLYILVHML